jgi:hypothetical protein
MRLLNKVHAQPPHPKRQPFSRGISPGRVPTTPAALLQQALPADWTSEEQLLFRNYLQATVTLQDTLTSVAKDRPWLLWRAAKILHKLRGALIRAAQAAEQENAKNATSASSR